MIPIEIARAYCAFASGGILPNPCSLQYIKNDDDVILSSGKNTGKRIISNDKAFLMNSLLQSVVTDGTAHALKSLGISFPVAGKTGTTNDCRDAWFIGYTPDMLALVWVGFDSGESIHSTGASAAVPIWAELMKSVPQYVSGSQFTRPDGIIEKTVCCESGILAVSTCPKTLKEVFLVSNAPGDYCPLHKQKDPIGTILKSINKLIRLF